MGLKWCWEGKRGGGSGAGLRREKGPLSVIPRVWTRVWAARSEGSASHQGVHASVAAKHSLLRHTEVAPGYMLEIRCYKQVLAMAVKALSFHQWRLCQSILLAGTPQLLFLPLCIKVQTVSILMVLFFFFISFCLWHTLTPRNWVTFSETNPDETAAIPNSFGFDQSFPFVAVEDVSIFSVFSSALVKVFCHDRRG